MHGEYKKALKKVVLNCAAELLPGFSRYAPEKEESGRMPAGSFVFRRKLECDAFVYVVVSPGRGQEAGYTISLGWSYGSRIEPHNYLEQFRVMDGRVWPTRKFQSGFEQLQVLEGAAAAWGETLPDPSTMPGASSDFELAVAESLSSSMRRAANVLPDFERAICA